MGCLPQRFDLVDPILGVSVSVIADIPLSDQIETRELLGLVPPEDTASTA